MLEVYKLLEDKHPPFFVSFVLLCDVFLGECWQLYSILCPTKRSKQFRCKGMVDNKHAFTQLSRN
jgi:hypothetical protein